MTEKRYRWDQLKFENAKVFVFFYYLTLPRMKKGDTCHVGQGNTFQNGFEITRV